MSFSILTATVFEPTETSQLALLRHVREVPDFKNKHVIIMLIFSPLA